MPTGRRWSHRIDVSMSAEMKEKLEKRAEANQTSLAQQVRVAIQHYLKATKS